MALQTDNLLLQDSGVPRTLSSADTIRLTGDMEIATNLLIEGNLTVQGSTTALEQERLLVEDNHILLNSGYTTTAAQTAGLVCNYLPTATTTTVAATGFTAGVVSTSNPTVITTGSGTFSAADLVLISGAADAANNGLFEVLTHTGTTLTIRGVGTTATVEDFTSNDFVTDTTVQGTITKVTVSVLRAGTDGAWEQGSGSATPVSFTDLGSGSGNSLTQAYVQGNTITTDAGNGSVIVAGTESLQVTATNGLNVDTIADFDVTSFDVQMTATNGFSIDGTAASNVSVTGGDMTVSTLTSGSLILDGVALVDINAGANLDIDVTGTYDMLATGAFSIDGTGASNVTATSGNLTLSTATSGDLILSSAANVTVDGTGVSIDGTSASNLTATGANLTVSTATSGTLFVTSAGLLDIDAAANMDIDVTGTYDMLATGAFSIDGTGASNVTATSGNLTLSTATSGGVNITSAGASTYTVPNATAAAWLLTDGTDNYMRVDSVDNQIEIIAPFVETAAGTGLGIVLTTDSGLAQGNLVYIKATTGNVDLADANIGNLREGLAIGVARTTVTAANPAQIFTQYGALIPVLFTAAPAAADNGRPVYLSQTAGQATMTAPSGASDVIYRLGFLQGGNGADTTPDVLWAPQFIARGPSVTDT